MRRFCAIDVRASCLIDAGLLCPCGKVLASEVMEAAVTGRR
jgi:hypothetical protein